jgi:thymidylate synthase
MFICEDTLDDLMMESIQAIQRDGEVVEDSSRGPNREIRGVLLRLTNPLARLSHSETKGRVFSPVGELAWYLSASNDADFVIYYITKYKKEREDDGTVHGAYGPRIFSESWGRRFSNVVRLLRDKPSTKKAVIQLFDSGDLCGTYKDIPCTCTLQFLIRSGRLHLITSMRSNDAYLGLPHDVFSFTMFQEIVARMIGVEMGNYTHFAGSLHLYDEHAEDVANFLDEGWQATKGAAMPPMPAGDPWPSIGAFLRAESAIRTGRALSGEVETLHPYWQDLVRLLRVLRHSRDNEYEVVSQLKSQMANRVYREFIAARETPRHQA